METSRATFSLRLKIMLLVVASVLATALLIGTVDYFSARRSAVDQAIDRLANETRLASSNVEAAYDQMKNDAFVMSRVPPILGIIRSLRNGGIDPQDGSTAVIWKKRLATIFTSIMAARLQYTQIRYIEIENDGQEIVRVDRKNDGSTVVIPVNKLQKKSTEPYYVEGLKIEEGYYYFSDVNYNRENGRIDPQRTPTMRMVLPVFDDAKHRFGMIVINADYDKLLRKALLKIPSGHDVYISDSRGDYIRRDPKGNIFRLEVAGDYKNPLPDFIKSFVSGSKEKKNFESDDLLGYAHPLEIGDGQRHSTVATFFLTPKSALLADANAQANRIALIGALLVIAALAIAGAFASWVTKPITLITEKIRSFGEANGTALDLPVTSRDEIGEMARAFRDLFDRLDLSNKHRAQLSVQLETFMTNSVDGVIVIDDQGIIETINPSALEMLDYELDEVVGKNVSMLMPLPVGQRHDHFLGNYRKTGTKTYLGTIRDENAQCKDGTIIPISLAITEMNISGRRVFASIVRDMRAAEHARQEIWHYTQELERSNQELDQFAYIASHDLKAPLRVIDNASSWLEEDLAEKLSDKDRKTLALLRGRVRRMDKLLDDLLEYSRVGRTGDDRYTEIITGDKLVDDVLVLLAPPPSMVVEVSPEFATIQVARMPLQQVMHNLINNAIKHHDRDSGTIQLEVEQLPEQYRFTVRDDGPGIPEGYQNQIFEMFRTLKPRDQVEGSGMGLALVKKTVEYFGGKIEVFSDEGRGAAFTFTWPYKDEKKEIRSGVAA